FTLTPPTPLPSTLSLHDALPICRQLGGEHVERLDLGRLRQQLARLGHERLRDRPVQMRLTARLVGEDVEDAERRRTEPHREPGRSEEHTSELQSPCNLVCRLLLE